MKRYLALIGATLALVGCSEPIPDDKQDYIGLWKSEQMHLLINADGTIDYKRESDSSSTSIEAPITEFKGDDFVVGFLFIETEFDVMQPPYIDGGEWKMIVDGEMLTKQ
ncbi:hypothetical protein [Vibrio intestinalis]|uniref:hypothetical protein n=1 Tax=Vibrio intestinalis TaxID=2933291 RepID=UPI0021A299DF|nr:hypothetical protein [Vibrio intestinalis]